MSQNLFFKQFSYFDTNPFRPELKSDLVKFKFCLLQNQNEIIVINGNYTEFPYHAMLLNKYCTDNNVESCWIKKYDYVEIYSKSYQIRGGGWISINYKKNQIRFFGKSTAYGAFDKVILTELLNSNDYYSGFKVIIE